MGTIDFRICYLRIKVIAYEIRIVIYTFYKFFENDVRRKKMLTIIIHIYSDILSSLK